jgi:multiple sugar transport system substrate-binding protein
MSGGAIRLKGMSWDHPRGYDPLVAASAKWREQCGVEVAWDRHSLQHFEAFPVDALARGYDLMVIDHPHIGDSVAAEALCALDEPGRSNDCAALAAASVGPSYASYAWAGRQWALPVDAAAQVQAFRADLLGAAPQSWDDVMALARGGGVACPLRPPHSLMAVYTLAANLGAPCDVGCTDLFDREAGAQAVEMVAALAALLDSSCYNLDPIDVLEAMTQERAAIALAPLIYGYVSYARPGFRPHALRFADIASAGGSGPVGSALGGAGIAVSAFSNQADAARDFAFWIASGVVQRTLYADAGGQPAHADAWSDAEVNAAAQNFYADTRATLNHSWLRPRHAGYLAFQRAASERLNAGLQAKEGAANIVAALNALYAQNLAAARVGAREETRP